MNSYRKFSYQRVNPLFKILKKTLGQRAGGIHPPPPPVNVRGLREIEKERKKGKKKEVLLSHNLRQINVSHLRQNRINAEYSPAAILHDFPSPM
jgi:hypothetical protein